MRLRSLTSPTVPEVSACALRLPISRLLVWWGWLAVPFILAHRSRRQGLRAPCALAALRPSSNLWPLRCGVPVPVSGNPARSLELVMQHDLFSSLDSFQAHSVAASALLVRDVAGQYRPAAADEVLLAAQRLLASQVRGSDVMSSPAMVKDFLRARLGNLPHEVFAVVHLDAQNRVVDYVEMFRGTVSQTSVYPREVVRDALLRNSCALVLVHNHPSGATDPSRADEYLTQTLKQAAALVDVRVLDHFIVAGSSVQSMAERGLV
jgi:DNA repair protein RadC